MSDEIKGNRQSFLEWDTVRLGDYVSINPESLGSTTPGEYAFRYIDISSVEKGSVDWGEVQRHTHANSPSRAKRVVEKGDVLLSTVRPNLKGHAYADWNMSEDLICSTGFAVLRSGNEVDPSYLHHLVFSDIIDRQLHERVTGSNYPAVRSSDVEDLRIPLPLLPEQCRIADVLDTVDAAIRETDAVIAKQEQVKTGLLQDLLTRGLDANGRLRDPEANPGAFRETELGLTPESWDSMTCGDVLSMSNGKSKTQKELETESGAVPVWGGNGRTGYCATPLVTQRGIVIGRVGEYCGSVHLTNGPSWITDNAIFATVESDQVLLDFAALYLDWFDLSSKSTRTGQPLMTQSAVKEVPFLCPSLDEQQRIIKRVRSLQSGQHTERIYQRKLQTLKTGLMQDLLTGRVRVPEAEAHINEVIT